MTHDNNRSLRLRPSVLAVQAALVTMAMCSQAHAADAVDEAVANLVQRTSTVELGFGKGSADAAKANEYSGLRNKDPYLIGGFELQGGGAWDSEDPTRWRLTGLRLGTDARSVNGEYQKQGSFKISFGYDELLRRRSDSYQTPLLGAGGNVLTLPSNWQIPVVPRINATAPNARGLSPDVTSSAALVSGVSTAPTDAQLAAAASLQAADLASFQGMALQTRRNTWNLGLTYNLSRQLSLNASFQHEDKTGLKPMGTVSRATGGDIATIIPDLIDQSTDQVSLGLQYSGDKLSLQGGYNGSAFTNHVGSMTWSNWALPGNAQTMSSAPGNQLHQLQLTAAYALSPETRITAFGAYSRATQNDAFLTAAYTPLVPVPSADALVVTKAANLKLNSRASKTLTLNAGYKYDERDNRTPVNTYGFYDAGEAKAATPSVFQAYFPGAVLASNTNLNANRAYSRRLNQLDMDADWRVTSHQALKLALEGQQIDRWCNDSWIACADAARTKENSLRLEWRAAAWDVLNARASVVHASRTVDYNEDAWLALVPAANLAPTGAPGGASAYATLVALGLTGYGPVSGLNPLPATGTAAAFYFANNNALANALYGNQNRISELPGMRRYDMADRTRDKARVALDWQAVEGLSLTAGVDFNNDDYKHSVYGLQKARSTALNLDVSYAVGFYGNLSAFYTHEQQRGLSAGNTYTANSTAANVNGATAISGGCFATIALRNASNKVDPCLDWTADMRDKVDTLGATYTHKGLLAGKLDLTGSLVASRARSTNEVSGGNYANNPLAVTGAPAGTVAAYYIAAQALPEVTTRTTEFRIEGRYAIDKSAGVRVGYQYQHMKATDWAYDGMQIGGLAGVLPSLETAPRYTVHTVGVAWIYSFR